MQPRFIFAMSAGRRFLVKFLCGAYAEHALSIFKTDNRKPSFLYCLPFCLSCLCINNLSA